MRNLHYKYALIGSTAIAAVTTTTVSRWRDARGATVMSGVPPTTSATSPGSVPARKTLKDAAVTGE